MQKYPGNKAGAKYGTGYCDAQCPHDIKLIDGAANTIGWNPSSTDGNSGTGKSTQLRELAAVFGTAAEGEPLGDLAEAAVVDLLPALELDAVQLSPASRQRRSNPRNPSREEPGVKERISCTRRSAITFSITFPACAKDAKGYGARSRAMRAARSRWSTRASGRTTASTACRTTTCGACGPRTTKAPGLGSSSTSTLCTPGPF